MEGTKLSHLKKLRTTLNKKADGLNWFLSTYIGTKSEIKPVLF